MRDDATVLLAGVLHNLNNYLQVIIGNASLGMNSSLECGTKNNFKVILSAANRCGETVQQIMEIILSKKRDTRPVDVCTVISEAIEFFKPITDNNIRISYTCEDIPRVYGNESDISQILHNLLSNTRDAIQNKGEIVIGIYRSNDDGRLHNSAEDPADYICISVRDNGPGIPESIREKLFTEVISTKKDMAHAGIGLVVSQFLAQRHGGWIECAHSDKRGTEFIVYFPACNDAMLEKTM